jgi:hypothetical protein
MLAACSSQSCEFAVQVTSWVEQLRQTMNILLSKGVGIPTPSLIRYETTSKTDQTNWGHQQVAINVAQWISPEFDVQVSGWIRELQLENKQLRQRLPISINTQLVSYKLTLKNGNIFEIPWIY